MLSDLADIMRENILSALSGVGLTLSKMIMFSSDGPNVNKSLKKKLNDDIKALGGDESVDIGSCTLHIVHNAFRAGLAAVPTWNIDELVIDMYYWFKNFPACIEDYDALYSAMSDDAMSSCFCALLIIDGYHMDL